MSVGELLVATFVQARALSPDRASVWTSLSWKIGGLLPHSTIMVTVQRLGEIDAVCRAIENELLSSPAAADVMDFRDHYYSMIAELWISTAYSICFILGNRKLVNGEQFAGLSEDLRIVRVQLEKHELASDRDLSEPLAMAPIPSTPEDPAGSVYLYDQKDAQRSHIGRRGVSARRSMMWEVIDLKVGSARWLERTDLSDRLMACFS